MLSKELDNDLVGSTIMAEDRMVLLEALRKGTEPGEEAGAGDDCRRRALSWLVHA